MDSASRSSGARTPNGAEDRTRDLLVAAGVIAAAAASWAIALGVLDRGATPAPTGTFAGSPAARVERRPVLFVVRSRPDGGADSPTVALPIASVDPGGAVRPPVPLASTDESRRAIAATFAADYLGNGTPLRLLYGGAVAGTLRFAGPSPDVDPLAARVASDPTSRADVLTTSTEDLLAMSDMRYGASASGARPLRSTHVAAVEQLARTVARERYPNAQVESVDIVRVRVADLDRAGAPELLASVSVKLRFDAHRETTAALFILGEAAGTGSTSASGGDGVHPAYVLALDTAGAGDGFAFVDQVDLTASSFDEVVVRADQGGASRYLVLERGRDGWSEAASTPPVSAR